MKHYKKEIAVNGRLLRPLMVGQSAFLYANGRIRRALVSGTHSFRAGLFVIYL